MDSKDKNNSFSARLERFIAGRGYYAVLTFCALVIAVSVWAMLREPAKRAQEASVSTVVAPVPADLPAQTPQPSSEPAEQTPAPTEAPVRFDEETTVTLEDTAETEAQTAFVMPVNGTLQRAYSVEALAYDETMRDWRTHDGVDFAAEAGEKVCAITSGTVTGVSHDDRWGTCVTIDHGNGLVFTYAGLQEIPTVYEGDTVSPGDTIGAVGTTCKCETAQGAHLHLSAAVNGASVSPLDFLPAIG
jgi:murein DD-endopeptidase MepM/ murein hydrolase activator NlpD